MHLISFGSAVIGVSAEVAVGDPVIDSDLRIKCAATYAQRQ